MMEECIKKEITIEQWVGLSKEGICLPVKVRVEGDSMTPLIRNGRDQVMVLPLWRSPRVGDIVLFASHYQKNAWVLHRVWRMRAGKIQTLGDGRVDPDIWMPMEEVKGLAVRIGRGEKVIDPNTSFWYLFGRIWMASRFLRKGVLKIKRMAAKHKMGFFML